MRPIRPPRLAALLLALALLLAPAVALGDGDPASDILLVGDTFFPYQPKVSPNAAAAVRTTVARARSAGLPLKVAVVAAVTDLGAVPDLFGQPQRYADFLAREISFNKKVLLLVVMPQGFGVAGAGRAEVLAGRVIPPGGGADGLARATIPAIGVLAADAGHPIPLAPIPSASGQRAGGSSALLTFGAPLVLVLLVAGGAAIARSRRIESADPRGEVDDPGEEPDGGSETPGEGQAPAADPPPPDSGAQRRP